jgi:uncharacterized protein involved in exopolysaccharide biosynthesis
MTNFELVKQLVKRLKKYSWVILLCGLVFGGLFFYVAKQSVVTYTGKSTVFPLNSTSDNTISTSAISNILGLADAPKSFTSEAAINIIELANSRHTKEDVAATRISSMQNKTIAQLLIEENNLHTGFMQNETKRMPTDSLKLINTGSDMLFGSFNAKINKNGILELNYTNSNKNIVKVVSYAFVDKISEFYTDLKKKKAQVDYEFAVKKADSLKDVLSILDKKQIALDESTFFTSEELKRYILPKANIENDKSGIYSQYYYAVNNREAAAYKLQKETPIINILDKPEEPYLTTSKSAIVYSVIGIMLGLVIGIIAVSWKVISQYAGAELNKAIEKASQPKKPAEEPIK